MISRENRYGLTLIEIMVTLFIMGILLAIGTINYLTYKSNMTTRENAKTIDSILHYAQAEGKKTIIPAILTFNYGGSTGSQQTATMDLRMDVMRGGEAAPIRRILITGVSFSHNLNVLTSDQKEDLGIYVDFYDNTTGAELGSIAYLTNGCAFSFAPETPPGGGASAILLRISRGTLGFDFGIDAATGVIRYTDFSGSY